MGIAKIAAKIGTMSHASAPDSQVIPTVPVKNPTARMTVQTMIPKSQRYVPRFCNASNMKSCDVQRPVFAITCQTSVEALNHTENRSYFEIGTQDAIPIKPAVRALTQRNQNENHSTNDPYFDDPDAVSHDRFRGDQ